MRFHAETASGRKVSRANDSPDRTSCSAVLRKAGRGSRKPPLAQGEGSISSIRSGALCSHQRVSLLLVEGDRRAQHLGVQGGTGIRRRGCRNVVEGRCEGKHGNALPAGQSGQSLLERNTSWGREMIVLGSYSGVASTANAGERIGACHVHGQFPACNREKRFPSGHHYRHVGRDLPTREEGLVYKS